MQTIGVGSLAVAQVIVILYGALLLFAIYCVWLTMAIWELGHRDDLTQGRRLGLGALVVAVPLLGPILYYFAGGSLLRRGFRLALVAGAPLLLVVITAILLALASVVF